MLLNPVVIQAALFGQLSFAWAATLLLFGVAAWRREATVAAVILVGLAEATHPAVVLPLAAILVVTWLPFEPRRARLVGCFALSVLLAAPAIILTLTSPVFGDASTRDIIVNFVSTVASRAKCRVHAVAVHGGRTTSALESGRARRAGSRRADERRTPGSDAGRVTDGAL